MGGSRHAQLIQDADTKSAQGDFARAINLYEAALDDSPRCAEVHYKLALLYDDKLNDPVSALHHFRRYFALSPTGVHAADVKNSIKRDEIAALTALLVACVKLLPVLPLSVRAPATAAESAAV